MSVAELDIERIELAMCEESPWRKGDLIRAAVITGLGLLVMGISWYGCAGRLYWNDQLSWIAFGVLGTVVSALGMTSWLVAGFRAVRAEERLMMSELGIDVLTPLGSLAPTTSVGAGQSNRERFVTAPDMTLFHLPACPAVRGKDVGALAALRAVDRRQPCQICMPSPAAPDFAEVTS